jgi:esterase/lipase
MAVIANEIEPLTRLQNRLKRLARLPARLVRKQLVRELQASVQREYEQDYEEFHVLGESKDKSVGRPFMVHGFRRRTGVLLLHGYLASPLEMAELARFLGKRGFTVFVPRIKGHGTSPDDLAVRNRLDWIESAEEGYIILRNTCRQVVAGGFSNGATLALDLATRVDDMAGAFAVSPPLKLQDFAARFAPAIDTWNRLLEKMHIDEARREFVENSPENPHINYLRNPVVGIRELEQLAGELEKKLPQIEVPALLVQSYRDPVVDERGSRRIFEQLGSENKRYLLVNFDRHGILLGPGAEIVHQAIYDFIRRL